MSSALHVELDNQLCFTIRSEKCATGKVYSFQRHLCINTAELTQ